MTTTLSAPVETSVSAVSALETARAQVEELVLLRTRIDAEIADAVRAYAQAEVQARLGQVAAGQVSVEQVEASIVDRLGRALRVSPTRARAQLRIGRDLHAGLDRVRDQFAAGELDRGKVAAVVGAASHLDPAERAEVDTRLAAHDLASLGQRRVADLARTIVAQIAPGKFTERAHAARRDRHVSITSAPDGMVVLRAVLPVEQGVACYAALRKAVTEHWVSSEPVTRTRGQIMADTLVARLTGTRAGRGGGRGRGAGAGPGGGRCTAPHCDARIEHLDHLHRWSQGGRTTLDNGAGLCAFHNLVRETPP